MNERKDLDRLFQEKFKDFEVAPPDFVWENIQEKLRENKKTRVVPLWYRLSGVAALLVLGGLLATLLFNDTENPAVNAPAVVIEKNTTTPADAVNAAPDTKITPVNATGPASPSNDGANTSDNANTAVASSDEIPATISGSGSTAGSPASLATPARKSGRRAAPTGNNDNAVAYQGSNNTVNKNSKGNNNTAMQNIEPENAVAANAQVSQPKGSSGTAVDHVGNAASKNTERQNANENALAAAKLKNSAKNYADNPGIQRNSIDKNLPVAAQNATQNIAQNEKTAVSTDNGTVNNAASQQEQAITGTTGNESRSSAIINKDLVAGEDIAQTTADTTSNTVAPVNELEKLLQEKLNEDKEEEVAENDKKGKDRWNIKPQVAPVFYNSLSDGSPINEGFTNNTKSYDNDLSYGLGVNYALSDRISIRSGVNTVNLSYTTNDIAYYASLTNMTSNISTSKIGGNIVVQNPGDEIPDTQLIDGQPSRLVNGSMLQQTRYIEVPMEMSYAVLNKKFGIDIIGGVSTLFLNKNDVNVISEEGETANVGRAENLNNVHFSTNIGLGFKYKFWDSFQANFEPTFKYQMNTYSRDAGNFKPYFIGLYTGVSFSF